MKHSAPDLSGFRVLVVEDEFLIARELVRLLTSLGAEVIGPAPTLAVAMALIKDPVRLAFAILDVNLRGEMVFPVADALQALSVPFLFATGYEAEIIPDRFSLAPYCAKPVLLEHMCEFVRFGRQIS